MSIWRIVWLLVFVSLAKGTKNICSNNRHISGTWKLRENLKNATKSFHCCGIDGHADPLEDDYWHNTTICGTDRGNWKLFSGSTEHETHVIGNACNCDKQEGRYGVNPREQYEWVPEFCDLVPWDGAQFCHLLGNRTILFVGDSTMQQTSSTVMSMVTRHGGKCANQLIYGKSWILHFASADSFDLFSLVRQFKPDICIMNGGAHQMDVGDKYAVLEAVMYQLPMFKEASPATKYVWRTINPGHTNCKDYTKPLKVPDVRNDDVYNYHNFPTYDKAGYEYANRLGWRVLDVSPLYLRPDAHSDCLHYCIPGPLDITASILLTMMVNGEI